MANEISMHRQVERKKKPLAARKARQRLAGQGELQRSSHGHVPVVGRCFKGRVCLHVGLLLATGLSVCFAGLLGRSVQAQEVDLKPGPLEKQLQVVTEMAFGKKPHPLPPPPWTGERLSAHQEAASKGRLQAYLRPIEEKLPMTLEEIMHGHVVFYARERLTLTSDKSARPDREKLLLWLDGLISRKQIILLDLSYRLGILQHYLTYRRLNGLPPDEKLDREFAPLLTDLERLLRAYMDATRVRGLLYFQENPTADTPIEAVKERLAEARKTLPAEHRDSDYWKLWSYAGKLEDEIWDRAMKLTGGDGGYYDALLLKHYSSLAASERQLVEKGAGKTDRREVQRQRARTVAAYCTDYHVTLRARLDQLRLCVLQGRCDRGYAGKGAKLPEVIKLPANHEVMSKGLDERALDTVGLLRLVIVGIRKNVEAGGGIREEIEDWYLRRGKDLPIRLVDALVDDLTQWLEALPATKRTVKKELLLIAGFPEAADKERLEKLTPEEKRKVEQRLKSTKQIRKEYNLETLITFEQDLDLLQALLKSYPTHKLVLVEASWPDEPKGRLRLADCNNLTPAAAARAYARLFEQMERDLEAHVAEYTRYMMALEMCVCMHLRAAAGE